MNADRYCFNCCHQTNNNVVGQLIWSQVEIKSTSVHLI